MMHPFLKKIRMIGLVPWVALLLPFLCIQPKSDDLVNLTEMDPTIIVDLKYTTADNFTGQVLYDSNRCFLRRNTAERLIRVQKRLTEKGLGLKVWDGYRPLSVQRKMWAIVQDPKFVSDPRKGSRHNRGSAVDVTLVDLSGKELPMPTPFDDFSPRASRDFMELPTEILQNRKILTDAMQAEGFIPLPSGWWHFDDPQWERYDLLDVPLTEVNVSHLHR